MEGKKGDREKMIDDFVAFLKESPSKFHVVKNISAMLGKSGFSKLDEGKRFSLSKGGRYYVTRDSSALIAFVVPNSGYESFSVIASHSDSPTFKVKTMPDDVKEGYSTLNVESYGGAIISSWFDRILSLSGRVFVLDGGKEKEVLFDAKDGILSLPHLAIHMDRGMNDGRKLDAQKEIAPIFNQNGVSLLTFVARKLGVEEENILSYDLYLYVKDEPVVWGIDGEYFSSPRIDNLSSAYYSAKALSESTETGKSVKMIALFDSEEVGSMTRSGALSDFLSLTMKRIALSLGLDEEEHYMTLSKSMMLSSDNGHAVHPNYVEKADRTNRPVLNNGILIKHSASEKYASGGMAEAVLKRILIENDIPYQEFANNSNIPGGSTLGNLSIGKVGIPTIDVGIGELAMHSAFEMAGVKDIKSIYRLYISFYKSR